MKDMEIKTENRYEYRKTQEKRKQMIAPDLFEFAYVPDWYGHLAELERLALPESWRFRKPSRETKNTETPILERYIHTIFRKQVIDFNSESDPRKADSIFHLENECVCFHTGLYTPQYKGIYGYFERNNFSDSLRDWYFRGFCDELSPKLRYIEPLPQKPVYHMAQSGINFNPEWPIRVNVNHILGDEENLERIPAKIRKPSRGRSRPAERRRKNASKRCRKHWIRRWRNYESEQPNHKGIRTYETESDGFGASG